ncbi:MAG: alanine--tRNA ligase [Candidatus Nanoarchaeia archaeon]|nr:alanine--tRNA ligase [Candidatus Nanoarchaeia archaeon]
MKAIDLKEVYLKFFESKGHKRIPSSSLIPENDPTVLFTTAGMHPLVPFLMGEKHPLGTRLTSVQKCLRTGDIDEVGDEVHHTFFEMLGNWSLGDYFKKESIEFSFEFLTKVLKIDISRLAVTCFEGDEDAQKDMEAFNAWKSLGISEDRIAFLPKKDNWWGPAGDSGPCGPDTEIFYWASSLDVPKVYDPKDKRWVEIWNNVFMQYNKSKDGVFTLLQQKNVDTGLGVERVSALLQGFSDNYLTERFKPIIDLVCDLSNKKYEDYKKEMRIVADHIRSSVFVLGDPRGISPSNVDQGYILRRFIRRVIRVLYLLDVKDSVLSLLASKVIDIYGVEYPELNERKEFILNEIKLEEEKFSKTLVVGTREFERIAENMIKFNQKVFTKAFLLFSTYGFPLEMTKEMAMEKGLEVDVDKFNKEMEKHQELSRVGAEKKFKGGLSDSSEITTKYHSATHILGEALRRVLDKNIVQKGSNITPERLRFDFNFNRKLTDEEKKAIEDEVNRVISLGLEVDKKEMKLDEALNSGAQAEFGNRYPEVVSVYSMGDYSKEICMGPHVDNVSKLGHFRILKEESSASGIRRIKAILE